jgi:Fe-Mn family superoxide dismutase
VRRQRVEWLLTVVQRATPRFTRSTYSVPTLLDHNGVQQKDVPGLLSAKGFRTAYTEYQQHMVDELNESTAGMHPDTGIWLYTYMPV